MRATTILILSLLFLASCEAKQKVARDLSWICKRLCSNSKTLPICFLICLSKKKGNTVGHNPLGGDFSETLEISTWPQFKFETLLYDIHGLARLSDASFEIYLQYQCIYPCKLVKHLYQNSYFLRQVFPEDIKAYSFRWRYYRQWLYFSLLTDGQVTLYLTWMCR